MKKKYIIIIVCLVVGLLLFLSGFVYAWMHYNEITKNSIDFLSWTFSYSGLSRLFSSLEDLGIGLIGSVIFLLLVDWTIKNAEKRIIDATDKKSKRAEIARDMRNNPKQTLKTYQSSESAEGLFNNQFFRGCNWSGLRLDRFDFSESDLTDCNLSNASLVETNLRGCTLKDVNFNKTVLTCTNLKDTDITEDQLKTASSLWNSIMPNGEKFDGRFILDGDVKEAAKYGYDIINDSNAKIVFFRKEKPS